MQALLPNAQTVLERLAQVRRSVRSDSLRPVIQALLSASDLGPGPHPVDRLVHAVRLAAIANTRHFNGRTVRQVLEVLLQLLGASSSSSSTSLKEERRSLTRAAGRLPRWSPLVLQIVAAGSHRGRRRGSLATLAADVARFCEHHGLHSAETWAGLSREDLGALWEAYDPRRALTVARQANLGQHLVWASAAHDDTPGMMMGPDPALNVAALINHHPYCAQRDLAREIFDCLPRDTPLSGKRCRAVMEALVTAATVDRAGFVDMDGDTLRRWGPPSRLGYLWVAKRQPCFDPEGRFSSHLGRVPWTVMRAQPALWHWPVQLALCFRRWVPDMADREHLLLFAEHVAEARMDTQVQRLPERIRLSIGRLMSHYLVPALHTLLLHEKTHAGTYRELLPRTIDLPQLVELVARLVAARNPQGSFLRCIVQFFNGAIANGVFENCGTRIVDRIRISQVRRHPLLRQQTPTGQQLSSAVVGHHRGHPITEEDMQALLAAVQNGERERRRLLLQPQDPFVLYLLYTAAPRAGAFNGLRPGDVWDPSSQRVHSEITVIEKFSQRRCIPLLPPVWEALSQYWSHREEHRPPGCVYLFGRPDAPLVRPTSVAQCTLCRVCRAAGLTHTYHPHQFRTFLTSLIVKYGGDNALDRAAKVLGHRSSRTTFQHYWDVNPLDVMRQIPFFAAAADDNASDGSLVAALEWEQARRQELETLLERASDWLSPAHRQQLLQDLSMP